MTAYRAATAEQAAFLADLIGHGHLVETGVEGIYGHGPDFDRVRLAFSELVWRISAPDAPEQMRFPPLLPRQEIETNGYLASFPHLAGTVFSFDGTDAEALELESVAGRHEDWSRFQSMTDLVVLPAACYPVYPQVAKRGPLKPEGVIVDTGPAWVFRREPSGDPARLQMFHMHELVRIGDPDVVARVARHCGSDGSRTCSGVSASRPGPRSRTTRSSDEPDGCSRRTSARRS